MAFRPLRYDGPRLNFEVFYKYLPGNASASDIDFATEVSRRFLLKEWRNGRDVKGGQHTMFLNASRLPGVTPVMVNGIIEDLFVREIAVYKEGKLGPWQESSLEDLCQRIEGWARRARAADGQPWVPPT